ncbi:unnamed protein product, partial [Closterium sp. NIES-53]
SLRASTTVVPHLSFLSSSSFACPVSPPQSEYQPDGAAPLAPSAIPIRSEDKVYISTGAADYPTPRAMTAEDIKKVGSCRAATSSA